MTLQDAGSRHHPRHHGPRRHCLGSPGRCAQGACTERADRQIHEPDDARRGDERHRPGAPRSRASPPRRQDRHHIRLSRRWFCGFTGNYVAAVWLGNDDYHKTKTLTGGLLPTVAWQNSWPMPIPILRSSRCSRRFHPDAPSLSPMPATAPPWRRPSGRQRCSQRPPSSCSILPTSSRAALRATGSGPEVAALAVTAAPAGNS